MALGARFTHLRGMRGGIGRVERVRDRVLAWLRAAAPPPLPPEIRAARHAFIFGVSGRSSTTALMRILNSTHEICVWGEPGDHVLDDLLRIITVLEAKNRNPKFADRKEVLGRAFAERNHQIAHAMAFPELRPAIADLTSALLRMFAPIIEVDRFGFKEITVRDAATLEALRRLFPNADFLYLFRDPHTQWPSVKKMGWPHLSTLEDFLSEYERLARIYIGFGGTFIADTSLRDPRRVARLTESLGLSASDERLVGDGVFAMADKPTLTSEELAAIDASPANTAFEQMRALDTTTATPV